jgi:hypothetical protein
MGNFISDEEMSKLESQQPSTAPISKKFISDEQMQQLEQSQKQEPQQVIPEREIGMGEAALKHAQGSLLVDEIVAGLSGAAGQAYGTIEQGKLPKLQELIDTYYEARAGQRAEKEEAFKQQPGASIVGGITGGLLTAPFTGGAAVVQAPSAIGKIGQAALTGAKFGAATGALQGEAKLTEGLRGVKQLGKETLAGAALGAGTGAALSGVVEGVKGAKNIATELIPEPVKARFEYGKRTGEMANVEKLDQNIRETSEKIFDNVKSKLKEYGVQKEEAIKLADEAGQRISLGEDIEKVINSLGESTLTESNKEAVENFRNILYKEYLGRPNFKQVLEKTQSEMSDLIRNSEQKALEATIKGEKDLGKQVISTGGVISDIDEFTGLPRPMKGVSLQTPNLQMAQQKTRLSTQEFTPEGDLVTRTTSLKSKPIDITPAKPSEITTGIDDMTRRPFAEFVDQSTGKVYRNLGEVIVSPDFDINNLTYKQADDLLPQLFQLTNSDNEIVARKAKQLYGTLRTKLGEFGGVSEAKEGLEAIYKPIAKNLNVDIAELNSSNKFIREQAIADLEKRLIQSSEGSDVDQRLLSEAFEKYAPEARKLMDDLKIFREARAATGGQQRADISRSGILTRAGAVGGNIAGVAANKFKGFGKSLLSKTPDQIQQIASKLSNSGSKAGQAYIKPLLEIANSNLRSREALLFTLTQQPGFKQAMLDIGEVEE